MKNITHDHEFPSVHDDADPRERADWSLDRRSFLKFAGFTIAATAVGCERPADHRVIPHVSLDPEQTPGASVWYASTCAACPAGCGVLVRSRDNRPIKLEGNPGHPLSAGGLCAAGQASVLGVYDAQRLMQPRKGAAATDVTALDRALREALTRTREKGGRLRVLAHTIDSPTLRREIDRLLATVPDAALMEYDPLSVSAMLDAHAEAFGRRVLPRLHVDRARVIVSFDADFLGNWIAPVEHAAGWARGRDADSQPETFSWHCQIEARMSLTGGNADERIVLPTAGRRTLLGHLASRIARLAGQEIASPVASCPVDESLLARLAARLWEHRGASLLLCGDNDIEMQRLTLALNVLLGNYHGTLDLQDASHQRSGDDRAVSRLLRELHDGSVDVLVVIGANPVYDFPDVWDMAGAIRQAGTSVVFAARENESSAAASWTVPMPHALEDWQDAMPVEGLYCLRQPTIPPRRDLRPLTVTLAAWRSVGVDALDLLRDYWRTEVFPRTGGQDFERFWHDALRQGFVQVEGAAAATPPMPRDARLELPTEAAAPPADAIELVAHGHPILLDSSHGGNAWLLELPDPVTKLTWDNVASLSAATATRLGLRDGDLVQVIPADGQSAEQVELPVLLQDGQADNCVVIAMGYGATCTARFDDAGPRWVFEQSSVNARGRVGARVSGLLPMDGELRRHDGIPVALRPTGRRAELARAQEYQLLREPKDGVDGAGRQRPCLQERSLAAVLDGSAHGDAATGAAHGAGHGDGQNVSMWEAYSYDGHHWAMSIDLSACTGCSACVVGCQVENNIPVVGKDEVRRNRDLHWIRIDRYYFDGEDGALRVGHQPMLCHHCDHAPCETVCPVLATVHSEEGLNQQVYNRCVGTRYCSNNCPYKVRRFNWFDYPQDDGETLVLNPDVTVRSRGIMEKCSFCVQRIQDAKIRAKTEQRPLVDGDVQPACMQSCPTRAIRFGDRNDSSSAVHAAMEGPRHYRVLDELGIKPSVGYLMQVRNTTGPDKEDHDG